jgi:polyisoprenyl-phosphate glycosyltransferase
MLQPTAGAGSRRISPQNPGAVVMPFLSIVIPVYNEELVLEEMYRRLTVLLAARGIDYELILVDDGSSDGTASTARDLCQRDERVKLIRFSRNFGHQIAITAGMDRAAGQVVAVIDADLQDPPETILAMIDKWREGYRVVYGVRQQRSGEGVLKRATAAVFYRLLRRLTKVDIPVDAGDFRLMDGKVIQQLRSMRERHRFVRGMTSWVGFKQCGVEYVREKRYAGQSKYPFRKMLAFASDAIFSFSHIPLRISSSFGLLCAGIGFVLILYGLISRFFSPASAIPGWASVLAAVLFLGGIQLVTIGILGEYLGRVYEEVKGRPLYVIEEELNFERRRHGE